MLSLQQRRILHIAYVRTSRQRQADMALWAAGLALLAYGCGQKSWGQASKNREKSSNGTPQPQHHDTGVALHTEVVSAHHPQVDSWEIFLSSVVHAWQEEPAARASTVYQENSLVLAVLLHSVRESVLVSHQSKTAPSPMKRSSESITDDLLPAPSTLYTDF
ncbi:hypothetical protein LZ31DRAFT_245666 [Colletotrichum somersetense]|nr:hypothetical protein LZ31DRAFT_245666 [Colletotrichum somersetense]